MNRITTFLVFVLVLSLGIVGTASAAPGSYEDCQLDEDIDEYRQCLEDSTTVNETMEFANTHPDELSQKQIDAVYAVYPTRHDEFDTEQEDKIWAWQKWEKFGIEPDHIESDSTTSTETLDASEKSDSDDTGTSPSPENNSSENASEEPQLETLNLEVIQPHYVSSVVKKRDVGGVNTYIVSGERVNIIPLLGENESVASYDVREENAELRYDKTREEYVLNPNGKSGTYRVIFRTENESYVANVKFEESTYAILSNSRYERISNQSDFGVFVLDLFGEWCNDDIAQCRDLMENEVYPAYLFLVSPFAALTGQTLALLIIVGTKPGAGLSVATVFLLVAVFVVKKTKKSRRLEKQMERIGDIDRAEIENWLRERKRLLSETNWYDLPISEDQAQAMSKSLGENLWLGFANFVDAVDYQSLYRYFLGGFEHLGYEVAVYESDDGDVESASVVEVAPEDADRVESPMDIGDDVLAVLDVSESNAQELERVPTSEFNEDALIGGKNDLIDELGLAIREREDAYALLDFNDEAMELIAMMLQRVMSSEYCNEDGEVREEMHFVELMNVVLREADEKFRVPVPHLRAGVVSLQRIFAGEEKLVDESKTFLETGDSKW